MAFLLRLFRFCKNSVVPHRPSFDELYPEGIPKAKLVRYRAPKQDKQHSEHYNTPGGPFLLNVEDLITSCLTPDLTGAIDGCH